ncbi:hypothetical protein GE21DRAFT_1831 [Neurospora crassa]|nr:uncharacterized protein NCU00874 [Neurospora crassa OR74A]ESA44246.1 hypothetical protein, variant [Neurospora crassa OR74A]KHE82194.1 hypothetical protein GE21DRAFT_1831 [Neurospora crassa]|eukprot:XP_011392839.1 uncharacterized protein NCU00874 [Neurospora crassa OR74A]
MYASIAQRIHTIYFLATPHRGADSAQTVKLLLSSAGYGAKGFVDDLLPGSGTLDQINDEFRHHCGNVHLRSFFEGVPTSFAGIRSCLVVDKDSAVLGLPNETSRYIEADHRRICKFESPVSPNYTILQQSFLTTIEDIEADSGYNPKDEHRSQMKLVSSFLHVDQRPDATLLELKGKEHQGSCHWVTEERAFQDWMQEPFNLESCDPLETARQTDNKKVLWLNGRPGTGKSVVAGHVIRFLEACNFDCSFYFFRRNTQAATTVSGLLLSMAYQMAQNNFDIRRSIAAMAEDGQRLSHADHHMIWSKLFLERIFRTETTRPQFWVIDAADECSSKGLAAFISMISNLSCKVPIRVFMTSRPGGQLERLLHHEKTQYSVIRTGQKGSMGDIELFVRGRFPIEASQMLIDEILARSNGIFLWASLTMTKLEDCYTIEDKQDALRGIPSGMDDFYLRIVESVVDSPSCELAKCILTWVICAPLPLRAEELAEAVKRDIGRTLDALPGQLPSIAGHLIEVDDNHHVHILHLTTSAFLTQKRDEPSFWIDKQAAHGQIAQVCLELLCGTEFAPPKSRRAGAASKATPSPLSDYAATNFSYHLMHSSSACDTSLVLLDKFLRSNVLTWIERAARSGDISILYHTAQRLKAYLARRAKYQPPLSVETQTISGWITDMYHIAAAFYSGLLSSPSSIHFLIPHLCPPRSMIHSIFTKPSKLLRITGTFEEEWSDKLTCYLFAEEALSLGFCGRYLAVGLRNGNIELYQTGSRAFGSAQTLKHGKRVQRLAFNQSSTLLASFGARQVTVWDIRRSSSSAFQAMWSQRLEFAPSEIKFSPNDEILFLANPQQSSFSAFDVTSGSIKEPLLLHAPPGSPPDSDSSDEEAQRPKVWTPAQLIRLDESQKLAALAYRDGTAAIWNLEDFGKIGCFEKEGFEGVYPAPPILDLIFNPVFELELLAISYKDEELVICNPWSLMQQASYRLQYSLGILAATSDGRILAGGDEVGAIHLFSFETLQPLYRIERPDERFHIPGLVFSSDNLRLFDIRGQCCNVWEPLVLIPRGGSDDSSSEPHSKEVANNDTVAPSAHFFHWGEAITTIESAFDGIVVFVGRQDGTVDICESATGECIEKLKLHDSHAPIHQVDWNNEKKTLFSMDISGRCILTRLEFDPKKRTQIGVTKCLDHKEQTGCPFQAILSPQGLSIFLHTLAGIKVVAAMADSIEGTIVENNNFHWGSSDARARWVIHPSNSSHVLALRDKRVHVFDWSTLQPLTTADGILADKITWQTDLPWISRSGSTYVGCVSTVLSTPSCHFTAFDASQVTPETKSLALPTRNIEVVGLQTVAGLIRSTLYFLDTNGWVCSISLKNLDRTSYFTRHFFIPPTWHTGGNVVIKVISKTAVALARGEKLIVFHGFLEFGEKVLFDEKVIIS